jgi:hypothetical protein
MKARCVISEGKAKTSAVIFFAIVAISYFFIGGHAFA